MQTKDIISVLRTVPLFSGTDEETLAALLTEDGVTLKETLATQYVRDESPPALGILLRGRANILSSDAEKRVILRNVTAGEVFDAAALFLTDPPPMSRIVALTDCVTLFVDAPAVRALMTRSPAFLDAYLAFLAERVQFLNRRIRCYTAGSAERRLALYLADNCDELGALTVSLSSLSHILDIGRASLYRALDKLEGDGLIRHDGRRITLLSRAKLLEQYQ